MSPSNRPRRLVMVTGTGTEIGKTWVACRLLEQAASSGLTVAARKPLQSFDPATTGPGATDAEQLAAATGEPPDAICDRRWSYPVALAPPMAADRLGRPLPALDEVMAHLARSWPAPAAGLAVVEGAGGVASPLCAGADSAALAAALRPDAVVLVADAALGVISSVRLAVGALRPLPVLVYLNRYDRDDDLHRRNLVWLRDVDGLQVVTEPAGALAALGAGRPA